MQSNVVTITLVRFVVGMEGISTAIISMLGTLIRKNGTISITV
jgi:hypothetical protein